MRKFQRGVMDLGLMAGIIFIAPLYTQVKFPEPAACLSKPDTTEKAKGGTYSYTVTACEVERRGK